MNTLFSKLGLTKKEADVFLKLLSLGGQPVSVIAKHAGIPRSSMYFVLEKLRERRLIEEFERAGVKYVKCIPVRDIATVLKAEERNLQHTLALLEEQLPALESLENTLSVTPKVKFSEGKDAVMKIYESLSQEKEFCTFFNPAVFGTVVDASLNTIPAILRESGGRAREVVVDSPEARQYQKKFHSERHKIKLLSKGATFLSDCIICKDRICMVTYGENQVAAIEIFGKTLASTHQTMFEELWRHLPA